MAEDRCVWKKEEIENLLDFIYNTEGYEILDNTHQRNYELYEGVSNQLLTRGFEKTVKQCRTKFKSLKQEYYKHEKLRAKSGGLLVLL